MKNIDKAKQIFKEQSFTFVMVNHDEVRTSTERGIRPMVEHVLKEAELMKGASIADKVIGKAAALLAVHASVSELYSPLVSRGAVEVCQTHGILLNYQQVVDHIQNRTKTGFCPMEALSEGVTEPEEMLARVQGFLNKD